MGDMARYLDELDAKSQDYAVRVQIACAQAIIEAINEQTVVLEMMSTMAALSAPPAATSTKEPNPPEIPESSNDLGGSLNAELDEYRRKYGSMVRP